MREGRRTAVFDGAQDEVDAHVLTGEPEPGAALEGPAICELPEATLVVPPGWRAVAGAAGTLRLERGT